MALEAGGCLCGLLRYQFDKDSVISAGHCHCRDCQKATGSGKATIVFVPTPALTIEGEYRSYTVTGSDGSQVSRGFCPQCGSPVISYVAEQPGVRFIKAGSLDDPSWVKPVASFWRQSAQAFDPVDELLPAFAANPPPEPSG